MPASRATTALSLSTHFPLNPQGLLSYGAELEFAWGLSMLTGNHLCSEVLYKEQYMPPYELARECRVLLWARRRALGTDGYRGQAGGPTIGASCPADEARRQRRAASSNLRRPHKRAPPSAPRAACPQA